MPRAKLPETKLQTYLKNPAAIEQKSFRLIRENTDLSGFDEQQQQVVMRWVHTCGDPAVASLARFSDTAIASGIAALQRDCPVLCDVEMVKHGLTSRYLSSSPLCFLNHPQVPEQARQTGESRSMTAVNYWQPHLDGSIAIIGNAPTALFRLLELMEQGAPLPALIIAMPVGWVGARESRDYLWENHRDLGVQCITISGRTGGSALAAATFNTLLRLQRGLKF